MYCICICLKTDKINKLTTVSSIRWCHACSVHIEEESGRCCVRMLSSFSSDVPQFLFFYWQTMPQLSDAGSHYRSQLQSASFSGAPPWIPPSRPGTGESRSVQMFEPQKYQNEINLKEKGEKEGRAIVIAFKTLQGLNQMLIWNRPFNRDRLLLLIIS